MELSINLIQKLIKQDKSSPKISIYIPTHPKSTSQTINADRIRFENALQAIEPSIKKDSGLSKTFSQLKELANDTEFWKYQSVGLAVFADEKDYQTVSLPYVSEEIAVVDKRYVVSPILAMKSMGLKYYLADINLGSPKLYVGSEYELLPVYDANLPDSIEDELGIEERKKNMKFRVGSANDSAFYYGHGDVDERHDVQVDRYLRILAERLEEYLAQNNPDAPLLLTGTDKRVAKMKSLLKYNQVLEEWLPINSNPNNLPTLHQDSYAIAAKVAEKARRSAVERYKSSPDDLKLDGKAAVIEAAENGTVELLLLPIMREVSAPNAGLAATHVIELPDDKIMFENATREVVDQGGEVVAVEVGDFGNKFSVRALKRY